MHHAKLSRAAFALWCVCFNQGVGGQVQESVQKSLDYVRSLETQCTWDHGYRCIQIEEDDFLGTAADQRMVPGPYVAAWQVCYADFNNMSELTPEQKQLRHYKIGLTENDTHFIVLFQGLLLPQIVDGKPVGTIRATFGLSTKYWVEKSSMKISKRLFLK